MNKHIHFDDNGKQIKNDIIVRYCWFKDEQKNNIIIAYLRNYRNGKTLYGASIIKKDKKNKKNKKDRKEYHRHIATNRLYNTPVYVTTSVQCKQYIIEEYEL